MNKVVLRIHPAQLAVAASPLNAALVTGEQPRQRPPARPAASVSGRPDPDPAAGPAGRLRLCDACQRPNLARDVSEYTPRRAVLVGERGLCVCTPNDA